MDTDTADNLGRKAVELTSNPAIKSLLQKKSGIKRILKPNITKGDIFGVTSLAYRLKERHLLLNPFKNEATLMNVDGEIKERF